MTPESTLCLNLGAIANVPSGTGFRASGAEPLWQRTSASHCARFRGGGRDQARRLRFVYKLHTNQNYDADSVMSEPRPGALPNARVRRRSVMDGDGTSVFEEIDDARDAGGGRCSGPPPIATDLVEASAKRQGVSWSSSWKFRRRSIGGGRPGAARRSEVRPEFRSEMGVCARTTSGPSTSASSRASAPVAPSQVRGQSAHFGAKSATP